MASYRIEVSDGLWHVTHTYDNDENNEPRLSYEAAHVTPEEAVRLIEDDYLAFWGSGDQNTWRGHYAVKGNIVERTVWPRCWFAFQGDDDGGWHADNAQMIDNPKDRRGHNDYEIADLMARIAREAGDVYKAHLDGMSCGGG